MITDLIRFSYKDHVTNKEVCSKIQQAIGPHEDLLMIVKRRKLQWYGHVSRSSGLLNYLARHSERGEKTRQTDEEVGRQHQGMDRPGVGPHEDLTTVKRRKLQWYGHVSHSSGLAKTILQGTVKGGRRKGRQRKRLEDIREWTGVEFTKSLRAVENRETWRKLVVKSSVVPQRPLWLRDR